MTLLILAPLFTLLQPHCHLILPILTPLDLILVLTTLAITLALVPVLLLLILPLILILQFDSNFLELVRLPATF